MNLVIAFLINSALIAMMLLAQRFANLPARGSLIPGTNQQFIYWQDFYCQKWGNSVGMPLMLTTFLNLYGNGHAALWWILCFGIGMFATKKFVTMCMSSTHKPDWGFPVTEEINLGGVIHLVYFFLYVSIISIIVFTMILYPGNLTRIDWITFCAGLIIYAISWYKDVKSGNFDPLKLS